MLSIGKVGLNRTQQLYYEAKVAKGREDYYAGGEAPGRWTGAGARDLGLSGDLDVEQLKAMMDGKHPTTGKQLAVRGGRSTTAAFDLTFSAPKSVSVLFAVGDRQLSRALIDAHAEAVDAALAYMEREACRVRRGHNGTLAERRAGLPRGWERARPEQAAGFVAAAYRHRMSRAQDPQLHTHVVCANMARGRDGRWTALDGTAIYQHAKAAGYLYEAHLREAVRERLPWVTWEPARNGIAEIEQVSRQVRQEFSQRRQRILEREAELEAAGVEVGYKGRERIAYDTREPKRELEEADWREQVRARAAEHGLGPDELAALSELPAASSAESVPERQLGDRLFSPVGLTATRNSFHACDVAAAVAETARQGASVNDVLATAERLIGRPEVVPVSDGLDRRFTTHELLAAEQRIVAQAITGREQDAGVLPKEHADFVLRQLEQPLSDEQEGTVRAIVTSGHRIDTVEALAGTGKTTSAGALRELYEQAGYRVVGAAPTGRAVRELKERAGISRSLTLDGWAVKLAANPTALSFAELTDSGVRRQPAVMILDEAGLAHTRLSARVLDSAMRAGVKVIAIGDSGQLSSVQAGGWLGALTRRLGSHELREVMRQRDAYERRLLAHLHRGDPSPYLKLKATRRELRLFTGDQPGIDAERAAIKAWAAASDRYGAGDAVIVCRDNQRRARLNQLARAHMSARGKLGASVEIGGVEWAVGDRVIARRNDHGRDLDNGMRATITTVDRQRTRLIVQLDTGGARELDARYVEQHVQHAYALTGHGMQGGTVHWAGVIGKPEDFSRNWSYTALSRARQPTQIFLVDEATQLQQDRGEIAPAPGIEEQADPFDRLAKRMRERDDEDLALEQLEHTPHHERPAIPGPNEPSSAINARDEHRTGSLEPAGQLDRGSLALVRLEAVEQELTRLRLELADIRVDDARAIVELRETIAAVEGEEGRDQAPRGLRDRSGHKIRSRERQRHLEQLYQQHDGLLGRTPDPDAVLARGEQLRQRQQQLGAERRQLRAEAIDEEIQSRPPWLTNTLGHEPDNPRLRERWQKAASEVAGHRIDHRIADPNTALDQHAPDPALRRAISDTRAALGLDSEVRDVGYGV